MNQVTNDGFIVIDGQVAMPEETAAELLNVTIEELRRASRAVGIKNSHGGIYVHNSKYYYSSHEILFKVRDINGKKSADLSTMDLIKLFQSAEERLLSQEEYKARRRKEQIKGVILIVIIGFFIHSCFSSDSEPKKVSAPPPIQTTAPVQQPAPAKVLNLGMTVEQFKIAFASAASSYGVPDLNINDVRYLQGSVQDSLRYDFSPNVAFVGIVNKSTGMIRSVDIMFTPRTKDDTLTAFLVYGIFMTIFNPELTPNERDALFNELKLSPEGILELKNVSPKAIRGNRRYSVFFIEEYGIFSLGVGAKDDN